MLQPPAGQAAAAHQNLDAAPFEQLGQAVCRVEFLRQGYQQSSGKPSQPRQRGLETQFSGCFQDAYRATDKPGHGQEKQQGDRQQFMLGDPRGLDEMDIRILETLVQKFGGGPVGLNTIAVSVGEEPDTIEEVYEPFLIQEGYLERTPKGRVATPACYARLGLVAPGHQGELGLNG